MGTYGPVEEIEKRILLTCSRSASLRFPNGTITDVAILPGNEAYLGAMKYWQHFETVSGVQ